jgi:hypothetical protein
MLLGMLIDDKHNISSPFLKNIHLFPEKAIRLNEILDEWEEKTINILCQTEYCHRI